MDGAAIVATPSPLEQALDSISTARATGGVLQSPVTDIDGFRAGDTERRREIGARVDRAARDVGFMQIAGHGIPDLAADGLTEAMDGFFALPFERKADVRPASVAVNRGCTGPKTENLSCSLGVAAPSDLVEAFNVGSQAGDFADVEVDEEHYPANLWPDRPAR